MRVNIDEIKEVGLRRAWDLPKHALDEALAGDRSGFSAGGPVHVEAALTRAERRVLLSVHAQSVLSAECVRCLTPVTLEIPIDFELTLVPEDEYESDPEAAKDDPKVAAAGSFGAGADEEVYRGKEIDLDPILREQVVLALPGYPVCKESCKGLCSICGANLNERECGCVRRVPDPRWAGLEKFKRQ